MEGRINHDAEVFRLAVRKQRVFGGRVHKTVSGLHHGVVGELALRPGLLDVVIAQAESPYFALVAEFLQCFGDLLHRGEMVVEMEEV